MSSLLRYDRKTLTRRYTIPWPWELKYEDSSGSAYGVRRNDNSSLYRLNDDGSNADDWSLVCAFPVDRECFEVRNFLLVGDDDALVLAISHGFFSHSKVLRCSLRSGKVRWEREFKDLAMDAKIKVFNTKKVTIS